MLKRVIEHKREEIKQVKNRQSLAAIKAHLSKPRSSASSFTETLVNRAQKKQVAIIAKIKQKSSSHDSIREDFNLLNNVQSYIQGGACCLSILIDEKYFGGRLTYLKKVQAFRSLPLLRKDFIIDDYQVFERKLTYADAILLLANVFAAQLQEFEEQAYDLGLDVLIEINHQEDIKKIEKCRSPIIGINNLNLQYFTTDISRRIQLKKELPEHKFIVCESGVRSSKDISLVTKKGIYIFLIGQYLMQRKDNRRKLKKINRDQQ